MKTAATFVLLLTECLAFSPVPNSLKHPSSKVKRGFSILLPRTRTSKFKFQHLPSLSFTCGLLNLKMPVVKFGDASTKVGDALAKVADTTRKVGACVESFILLCIAKSLVSSSPSLPSFAAWMLTVIAPIVPFLPPVVFQAIRAFFSNIIKQVRPLLLS